MKLLKDKLAEGNDQLTRSEDVPEKNAVMRGGT
jgi:hypothetical protein